MKNKKITFPFYCKDKDGEYHKFTANHFWWRIKLYNRGSSKEFAIMTHRSKKDLIESFINFCIYTKITEEQWLQALKKVNELSLKAGGKLLLPTNAIVI